MLIPGVVVTVFSPVINFTERNKLNLASAEKLCSADDLSNFHTIS